MTVACALYARVSDKYNQEDNSSLDAQLERARAFARGHDWQIVAEARETFSGGDEMVLGRPEFFRLLEMAEQKQISKIVVDIPDRLGRGTAIPKCETLAELNGCAIVYVSDPFAAFLGDGDDDGDDVGRGIMRLMGEQARVTTSGVERLLIKRRLTGGKEAWARQGRIIASAIRTYGYHIVNEYGERGRKVGCHLEIDEQEAEIVRQIFDWFVHHGLSPYAIAKKLTEMGIVTPSGKDARYGKELGDTLWNRSTISSMLKNETYGGTWHFNKVKTKRRAVRPGEVHRVTKRRPKGERIAVPCPAIVDRETWETAQEIRQERSRKDGGRPPRRLHLLKGLITCVHCGLIMTSSTVHSHRTTPQRYYRCRRNLAEFGDQRCTGKPLREDVACEMVWQYIEDILQDENALLEGVRVKRAEAEKAWKALDMSIAALDAQIARSRARLDRLLDLYLDGLDKAEYQARAARIQQGMEKTASEKAELVARRRSVGALLEDDEPELLAVRAAILHKLEQLTVEQKRQVLAMLGVRCIWNDETRELTVLGALKVGKLRITSPDARQNTTFHRVLIIPPPYARFSTEEDT